MALAILRFLDSDNYKCRFQVELGSNSFYEYRIGEGKIRQVNGLQLLDAPSYISPLIGPINQHPLEKISLEIPCSKFSSRQRAIQIFSFRGANRVGPAISEIVILPTLPRPALSNINNSKNTKNFAPISLGMEISMKPSSIENVAFRYREVTPVSSAMAAGSVKDKVKDITKKAVAVAEKKAVGAITSAVSSKLTENLGALLPQLAGIIAAILPKISQENMKNLQTGQPINREEVARLLESLLQQIGTIPPSSANPAISQGLGYEPLRTTAVRQLFYPNTPLASRFMAAPGLMSRQNSNSFAVRNPYTANFNGKSPNRIALTAISEVLAAVLPALLKITPDLLQMLGTGLMPTFRTVFKPQTLMAGQMSAALGMGEQNREDEAVIMALGLALAASATADLAHERLDVVELGFSGVTPLRLNGREKLVYHRNQEIAFPLTLKTPKPIQKGRLQLLVKHPKTLEILIEENYQIEDVNSGVLAVVPKISREKLQRLPVNEEYLICVTLVWKGRNPTTQQEKRLGASAMQLVTLMGDYWFDRLEATGETIPLNDVQRFRNFWHKIWEGEFESVVRQITLDCKYYYALETDRSSPARMETVMQFDKTRVVKISGRLKSGLIVDLHSLNALIPQVSAHPALSQSELEALMTPEFKEGFSNVARNEVEFPGKKGDKVALWVYPEIKLQKVVLKEVARANDNGLVQEVKERFVFFPMVAIVHFIGVAN
ncbi:hypothetical protein H6G33_31175 [Calothrix sp. FACHB-1219]|uniref:hypothetical protein n=1 Tax=unclassified Calothrix TaxID=2619626 RepID=UPI001687B122|nr:MULTISPECIES: hypothetical protein [unclassified Calothrix]MBD2206938.1 hypothetical protein [Calothrix sp. FACHB-168]MBD2221436.1 hypothetical protein [Calothrix sp. FACHB-1219]